MNSDWRFSLRDSYSAILVRFENVIRLLIGSIFNRVLIRAQLHY